MIRRLILNPTLIALLALSVSVGTPAAAGEPSVVQRDVSDAFVDTFFLSSVPAIRAQMPANFDDLTTSLVAGIRVDNFDAIVTGGPYASLDDLLLAFYDNQKAFNDDPARNRIRMNGTVRQIVEEDGTVLVTVSLAYESLPLSLYELNSFLTGIFVALDPAQVIRILEDGSLNGLFQVEMEIPFPGAPLHFWDSALAGGLRRVGFVGEGEGWLVDESGARTSRAKVHIHHGCVFVEGSELCSMRSVDYDPIAD